MAEITDRDIMTFNKSTKEEMILTLYGLIDNWENEVRDMAFETGEMEAEARQLGGAAEPAGAGGLF